MKARHVQFLGYQDLPTRSNAEYAQAKDFDIEVYPDKNCARFEVKQPPLGHEDRPGHGLVRWMPIAGYLRWWELEEDPMAKPKPAPPAKKPEAKAAESPKQ